MILRRVSPCRFSCSGRIYNERGEGCQLAPVTVPDSTQVQHRGRQSQQIVDRDQVNRRLRRLERLADIRQRHISHGQIDIRDPRSQDERGQHHPGPRWRRRLPTSPHADPYSIATLFLLLLLRQGKPNSHHPASLNSGELLLPFPRSPPLGRTGRDPVSPHPGDASGGGRGDRGECERDWSREPGGPTPDCAGVPSPGPTPAPATASPWPPASAAPGSSTRRSRMRRHAARKGKDSCFRVMQRRLRW